MKLSAKLLKNVVNINAWEYASEWSIAEGSAYDLYFQIIDQDRDIRYMSQATTIDAVTVTFLSIDSDTEITKTATQPFADDKSIWKITLAVSEVPNSGAVQFSITEDTVERKFKVEQAVSVELLDFSGC